MLAKWGKCLLTVWGIHGITSYSLALKNICTCLYYLFLLSTHQVTKTIKVDDDDDDDDEDVNEELFLWYSWPTKGVLS